MKSQVVLATALMIGAAMPALAANPKAQPAAGKRLFDSNCAMCHRADGSGGVKVGTAESADLRSPGLEETYHHNDALILRAILEGKDGDGGNLEMVMPHWKGKLSKTQANELLAYVKTLCCHSGTEHGEGKEKEGK
jgi:mono/diheme cytochrome c family protein